jgi:hypothetical protein
MSDLRLIHDTAIRPAMALLPKAMDRLEATLLLLAISGQEADLHHRFQVLTGGAKGPARGLWQFEKGGVRGVCRHSQSMEPMRLLCRARDVSLDPTPIWEQLEFDDVLAAGVARLLLWTHPKRLPAVGDEQQAWDYYEWLWRPGKPRPKDWPRNYSTAMAYLFPPETKEKDL